MQKISNITPTATSDGLFTNGAVASGTSPTLLDAAWFNTVQTELVSLVLAAGMALDPNNNGQVLAAIQKLTLSRSNPFGDIAGDGTTNLAISNLGLSKVYQQVNANLNALSGLQSDKNKIPYFIGPNAAAMADFTQTGRDIVGKNSAAEIISYLDLSAIYQAINPNLIALSGLMSAVDTLPYFFGQNKAALTAFTSFGRDVVGQASAGDLFKYLGIGTAANKNTGNGSGQLPDMSFFDSNFGVNGYQKLPSGLIIQWGSAPATIGTLSTKAYPIQFPNAALHVVLTHNVANDANGIGDRKSVV